MQEKEEANEKIATKKEEEGMGEEENNNPPPLMALNHVSRLCRNLKESIDFYAKRPHAFDFDGAWLFNYGVGVHLLQAKDEDSLPDDPDHLDPNDNHISFQGLNIKYKKRTVEDVENRTKIDQLFFNEPDGFMIEICNCENLKLVPAGSLGKIKLPVDRHNPPVELENGDDTK
ncbi:hypothetical protein ACB092_11G231400 [Castanea dentata]